mmetsp:Transcript_39920/g.98321  ORF Transcript_39920/g.98321 Transcript_39920/m.98321 type:complete len:81 (-) Transcript_39920:10-252(-)
MQSRVSDDVAEGHVAKTEDKMVRFHEPFYLLSGVSGKGLFIGVIHVVVFAAGCTGTVHLHVDRCVSAVTVCAAVNWGAAL